MTAEAPATVSSGVVEGSIRLERAAGVLRDVARGGLAGILAGFAVGGIGGRIAMTIAARLNPDATGLRTENGNVVGVFSFEGTFLLLLFGGIFAGMLAGVVWVVVSPWLPVSGWRRALLAFPVAAALGSASVIESTNRDFRILDPDEGLIALFVGLVGLIGATTAMLDGWLERRLPRGGSRRARLAAYGLVAMLGLPGLIQTLVAFLSPTFSRAPEPTLVGVALIACGGATVAWWIARIALGASRPPRSIEAAGRLALLVAVVLGAAHLWAETERILLAG